MLIQLETAKLELEAKRLDLRNSDLRIALSNPETVAAIIAALVTISSAIISGIVTEHQENLEAQRSDLQIKADSERSNAADRLERLKFESH